MVVVGAVFVDITTTSPAGCYCFQYDNGDKAWPLLAGKCSMGGVLGVQLTVRVSGGPSRNAFPLTLTLDRRQTWIGRWKG